MIFVTSQMPSNDSERNTRYAQSKTSLKKMNGAMIQLRTLCRCVFLIETLRVTILRGISPSHRSPENKIFLWLGVDLTRLQFDSLSREPGSQIQFYCWLSIAFALRSPCKINHVTLTKLSSVMKSVWTKIQVGCASRIPKEEKNYLDCDRKRDAPHTFWAKTTAVLAFPSLSANFSILKSAE